MNAVFLGGSRRISRLNEAIRSKLDQILQRGFWIFVGDANGADRAIQQHLVDRGCDRVTVYCVTGGLRNNVGGWSVRPVDAPAGARGFALYSAKDVQMAQDASYGLMLWDGESRGTLANVRNLLAQGKPVSVYLGPSRRFVSLRSTADLQNLGAPSAQPGAQVDLDFATESRRAKGSSAEARRDSEAEVHSAESLGKVASPRDRR